MADVADLLKTEAVGLPSVKLSKMEVVSLKQEKLTGKLKLLEPVRYVHRVT